MTLPKILSSLSANLSFQNPSLEERFASSYGRKSVRSSCCLRVVQALCWTAGLRHLEAQKWKVSILIMVTAMISLELLTCALIAANKQYHRHDKIKSYRFVLATMGNFLLLAALDHPMVNHTVFPAISRALFVIFDQMRLQSAVNVYGVNVARQSFLATCHDVTAEDLGEYWARQARVARRDR
ncbi:hypothetical protein WJX73_001009 [Symbiochloris irregularis]|uniref:LAGLIDADG homing endonuclease n=1 Tax=Symbiochloris irregularis TaxID=706552 RepID=A0AAW1NUN9_9CHLO